jgi:hypothetical protein
LDFVYNFSPGFLNPGELTRGVAVAVKKMVMLCQNGQQGSV